MIYRKDQYIVFRAGNGYIAQNMNKKFDTGHTHLNNYKSAVAAIDFVRKKKIPKRCGFYYLRSLIRLSEDQQYIEEIERLIEVRKQKGKKRSYRNKPVFIR